MSEEFNFTKLKEQTLSRLNLAEKRKIILGRRLMKPETKTIRVISEGKTEDLTITRHGCGPLETPFGNVWMMRFSINDTWKEYNVILKNDNFDVKKIQPNFNSKEPLMLRTDSGCATGQLFLDKTCECREQLHQVLQEICKNPNGGMIIHIPNQDGRGKGLAFKLATLYLQKELGLDTIQAASMIDNPIDDRTYGGVVAILKFIGIKPEETRVNFATNNPHKIRAMVENGYQIIPHEVHIKETEATRRHLKAKGKYLHHIGIGKERDE